MKDVDVVKKSTITDAIEALRLKYSDLIYDGFNGADNAKEFEMDITVLQQLVKEYK